MTRAEIKKFFEILRSRNPEPTTELNYTNPYTLLVAVVLSAQMTDKGVNKATGPLFKKIDNPKAMVKLGEDKLRDYIKSINLNNNKARNVIALSQILLDSHDGKVPHDREALESLPGVGRKTANVVLNTAFHEPVMAVDTHIFRVANRTGLAPGNNPREVEDALMKVVPNEFRLHAHHWLLLHGRYICIARTPKCHECPVTQFCDYYKTVVKKDKKSAG